MRKSLFLTVSSFALVAIAILNQGCASNSPPKNILWSTPPGTSEEQFRRDVAACKNEALVNGRAYSPIPANTAGEAIVLGMFASSAENNREFQIFTTCMEAKGYVMEIDTNAPPPPKPISPKQGR
jgi:hypothetical protein